MNDHAAYEFELDAPQEDWWRDGKLPHEAHNLLEGPFSSPSLSGLLAEGVPDFPPDEEDEVYTSRRRARPR